MRIRIVLGAFAATVVSLLVAPSPSYAYIGPGDWPDTRTGWSHCDWEWKGGGTISVKEDPSNPLVNSEFRGRLQDAIDQWNTVSGGRWQMRYDGVGATFNVHVVYVDDWHLQNASGYTYVELKWQPGAISWLSCLPQELGSNILKDINISRVYLKPRGDYFTRDASWRSHYEHLSCNRDFGAGHVDGWRATPSNSQDNYLCSKRLDFGSLIAHELGHTLVLHHPQSIDDYVYGNTTSFSADQAACNESTSRWTHRDATMCNVIDQQTTAMRTLDGYDKDSAQHHLNHN